MVNNFARITIRSRCLLNKRSLTLASCVNPSQFRMRYDGINQSNDGTTMTSEYVRHAVCHKRLAKEVRHANSLDQVRHS